MQCDESRKLTILARRKRNVNLWQHLNWAAAMARVIAFGGENNVIALDRENLLSYIED